MQILSDGTDARCGRNNKSKTGGTLSTIPRTPRLWRGSKCAIRYGRGQRAVDYMAHQLSERQRRRWCEVDEVASLHIQNAKASTERPRVNRSRLYPTVSDKKTSAIIQQAVFPCSKWSFWIKFFINKKLKTPLFVDMHKIRKVDKFSLCK